MVKKLFNFRLDKNQHERLRAQALAEGHTTISSYIRFKLFSGLSIDEKLNQILEILNKLKEVVEENES